MVTQKKQLTCDTIKAFNRKNNNLCSSLAYWQPRNNGFYTYTEAEPEDTGQAKDFLTELARARDESILSQFITSPEDKTNDVLTKYSPEIKSLSVIVTDIKTGNYEELEQAEEEQRVQKELEEDDSKLTELEKLVEMPLPGLEDYDNDIQSDDDYFNEEVTVNKEVNEIKQYINETKKLVKTANQIMMTSEDKKDEIMEKVAMNKTLDKKDSLMPRKEKIDSTITKVPFKLGLVNIKYLSHPEQLIGFQERLKKPRFLTAALKCSVCVVTFDKVEELLKHVDTHNNKVNAPLKCKICQDKFWTETELKEHQSTHWYQFSCRTCSNTCYHFLDLVSLCLCTAPKKPIAVKTPPVDVAVEKPTVTFKLTSLRQDQLAGAMKTFHYRDRVVCMRNKGKNINSIYECDVCGVNYVVLAHLEKHMSRWHRYKYTCNACGRDFYHRRGSVRHNCLESAAKAARKRKCSYCDKLFKFTKECNKHVQTEHLMDIYKYHCSCCGHRFKSSLSMYKHQLQSHKFINLGVKELCDENCFCAECNLYFVDQTALNNHMVLMGHEGGKDVQNACWECRTLFENETIFTHHMMSIKHKGEEMKKRDETNMKQCCYCQDSFVNTWDYRRHFALHHPGFTYKPCTPTVLCERCGASVYSKGMDRHMKLHDGTLGYHCKICNEMCATPAAYIQHVMKHTPRPYICSICGHANKHRCEIRDHILKSHAPLTPYECGECSRRFAHLDFLQAHCLMKHKLNLKESQPQVFNAPKNSSAKFYVYQHMKVIATHMDPEIVSKATVELCDYMGDTARAVDYKDHFLFDVYNLPVLSRVPKKEPKRTKSKKPPSGIPKKKVKVDIKDGNLTIKIEGEYEEDPIAEEAKRKKRRIRKKPIYNTIGQDSGCTRTKGQDFIIKQKTGVSEESAKNEQQEFSSYQDYIDKQQLDIERQIAIITGAEDVEAEYETSKSSVVIKNIEYLQENNGENYTEELNQENDNYTEDLNQENYGENYTEELNQENDDDNYNEELNQENDGDDYTEELHEENDENNYIENLNIENDGDDYTKELKQKHEDTEELHEENDEEVYTEEIHEIIESDGKQFVLVDGILYQICSNEV